MTTKEIFMEEHKDCKVTNARRKHMRGDWTEIIHCHDCNETITVVR